MENNVSMLKTSATELNNICKEIESNDLENIDTDEHFITTVIDSVSVPAYGILSQCQLRHRKLEELIDEYEKELRSLESTEALESNDELTVSNASDLEEDATEDDEEEDMEENDEGIEDEDDEISSQIMPELRHSEVRNISKYM